jgi:hypothetical protein
MLHFHKTSEFICIWGGGNLRIISHFIALTKRESVRRFFFCNYRSRLPLSTGRPVTTKNTGKYDGIGNKKEKKRLYNELKVTVILKNNE